MNVLAVKVPEACRLLGGISRSTLYRLEVSGRVRAVPHSTPKLFSYESLKNYVNGRTN